MFLGKRSLLWIGAVLVSVTGVALYAAARDPRVGSLIRNTLLLAGGTAALALPVGTSLALLLLRTDVPLRRVAIVLFSVLLFVPLYLQAAAWDAGFGQQGWLSLTSGSLQTPVLAGWRAAIWIHAMAAVPWVMLIVGIGLRLVEPEAEEAALLDASTLAVFWRVTLMRALPSVGVAGLWIFVVTAGEMTVTDLYQVRTYTEEVYAPDPIRGAPERRGFFLGGIALTTCVIAAAFLANSFIAPGQEPPPSQKSCVLPLRGRWLYGAAIVAMLALIVGVPVGNLCYKAGFQPNASWSIAKFGQIVIGSFTQYSEPYKWTLVIGSCAALAAVTVGAPLAWLARRNNIRAAVALCIVSLALSVPGPIVALAIIWLINRDNETLIWLYDRTIFAPWLAMTIRAFPIATLSSWFALSTVSKKTLEAAALEGAGEMSSFFRIAVAQRWPALLASLFASFAIAGGDVAGTILVIPPGMSTVPVEVFSGLHSGVYDRVAGICLGMVGTFVIAAAIAIVLFRWRNDEAQRVRK